MNYLTRRQNLAATLQRLPWVTALLYQILRRFQTKYTIGAVGVVLNDQNEVLLVEHVFHPYHPWGLPGGWVGFREDPARAVEREIHEELQLPISVGPLLLAEFHYGNHLDLAYMCRPTGSVGLLSFELLGFGWFAQEKLPVMHVFHQRAIARALEYQQSRVLI